MVLTSCAVWAHGRRLSPNVLIIAAIVLRTAPFTPSNSLCTVTLQAPHASSKNSASTTFHRAARVRRSAYWATWAGAMYALFGWVGGAVVAVPLAGAGPACTTVRRCSICKYRSGFAVAFGACETLSAAGDDVASVTTVGRGDGRGGFPFASLAFALRARLSRMYASMRFFWSSGRFLHAVVWQQQPCTSHTRSRPENKHSGAYVRLCTGTASGSRGRGGAPAPAVAAAPGRAARTRSRPSPPAVVSVRCPPSPCRR